jgi:hypothetical protein
LFVPGIRARSAQLAVAEAPAGREVEAAAEAVAA